MTFFPILKFGQPTTRFNERTATLFLLTCLWIGLGQPCIAQESPRPVATIPDTARAELVLPEGFIPPAAVSVVPDTVNFGGVAGILVEFSSEAVLPESKDFALAVDWLSIPETVSAEHMDRLRGIASRQRASSADDLENVKYLILPVRAYRTDPFLLFSGQVESKVIHVRGQTTDLASTAPIRDPRLRGLNLLVLAAMALLFSLVAMLIWSLWRRRVYSLALVDWIPPDPAWMGAADRLNDLLDSRSLDRGNGRDFLNELASIARGFAADRYRIAAREMTSKEIVSACLDRGFNPTAPNRLARLIEDADCHRYNPDSVDPAWCRNQAGLLINQISAVRVVARHTPVAPEAQLGSEKAWKVLQNFLTEVDSGYCPDGDQPLSGEVG